jgi:hypothetical protein
MLEPLQGLPDGVIGFEATGEIHSDDWLTPGEVKRYSLAERDAAVAWAAEG